MAMMMQEVCDDNDSGEAYSPCTPPGSPRYVKPIRPAERPAARLSPIELFFLDRLLSFREEFGSQDRLRELVAGLQNTIWSHPAASDKLGLSFRQVGAVVWHLNEKSAIPPADNPYYYLDFYDGRHPGRVTDHVSRVMEKAGFTLIDSAQRVSELPSY